MRFVDTNVLVYAQQPGAGAKHEVAKALLRDVWAKRDGALSAQVLQEFYVTVTLKVKPSYSLETATRIIERYLRWRIVAVDGSLVREAIAIQGEVGISYWDAAIVAAARRVGARSLLTEDLNHGQTIRGVTIENPFRNLS